jgi:acyl dehydratase
MNQPPVGTTVSGSPENPHVGIPDLFRPLLFDDTDLPNLTGRELTSAWFRVAPQADVAFYRATFLDRVYGEPDDQAVVEGFYLLALLDPLLACVARHRSKQRAVLNYGTDRVRFVSPVRQADPLRLHATLIAASARPSGLLATWRCVLEVAGRERPALTADWLVLFADAS